MAYNPAQFVIAIQSLRPGTAPIVDFLASMGENGPFISAWLRSDIAAPTQPEIEAVDTDALLAAQATILPQDLMAQFTPADMVKIMAAITTDMTGQTALLWYSMVAQRDPMTVSNARFKQGWALLTAVLGVDRMTAIAKSLGIAVS